MLILKCPQPLNGLCDCNSIYSNEDIFSHQGFLDPNRCNTLAISQRTRERV